MRAQPTRRKQYSIPLAAREGITLLTDRLKAAGILVECWSPRNTSVLPVKTDGGNYQPVQDLRLVNEAAVILHPNVPNPYTLLSLMPPNAQYFTCLDAFFSIRVAPISQRIFAF